jgi:hypothetical protein
MHFISRDRDAEGQSLDIEHSRGEARSREVAGKGGRRIETPAGRPGEIVSCLTRSVLHLNCITVQ